MLREAEELSKGNRGDLVAVILIAQLMRFTRTGSLLGCELGVIFLARE